MKRVPSVEERCDRLLVHAADEEVEAVWPDEIGTGMQAHFPG
jgi:hypothetical protein